jgi:hypothetical protein
MKTRQHFQPAKTVRQNFAWRWNLEIAAQQTGDAFSLILTFSRREKEQPLASFVELRTFRAVYSRCFARALGTFLPLPAGEGRGEGESGFYAAVLKGPTHERILF